MSDMIEHSMATATALVRKAKRWVSSLAIICTAALAASALPVSAQTTPAGGKKPNILVIWGDDVGNQNISHTSRGMMGYQTPNIDRIAKEGVGFTDYYAQQSCTAGRAAFIGGSVPLRNGMLKVGMPGAKEGWQKTDVTMATVLKAHGLGAVLVGSVMGLGVRNLLINGDIIPKN